MWWLKMSKRIGFIASDIRATNLHFSLLSTNFSAPSNQVACNLYTTISCISFFFLALYITHITSYKPYIIAYNKYKQEKTNTHTHAQHIYLQESHGVKKIASSITSSNLIFSAFQLKILIYIQLYNNYYIHTLIHNIHRLRDCNTESDMLLISVSQVSQCSGDPLGT